MNAKEEVEQLMNDLLPFGKRMLLEHGEFFPYGGFMKLDSEIVHVGVEDPQASDSPSSAELFEALSQDFKTKAHDNLCKATAILFNVSVPLPESGDQSDAIQVNLDHVDGCSAEVFFPYEMAESGEYQYGQVFAQEGDYQIFGET